MLSRQVGKCGDGINRFYRSMLRLRGFRISSFRIPNLVWGMGRCGRSWREGGGVGHRVSHLVGHWMSDGGGRNLAEWLTGKEGRKGTEWTPDPGNKKPLGGT
jgi:hypothetical protein